MPSIQITELGVSENRGPLYSTPNSRILIIRKGPQNKVPLNFGNPKPKTLYRTRIDPFKEPLRDPFKGTPHFRKLPIGARPEARI